MHARQFTASLIAAELITVGGAVATQAATYTDYSTTVGAYNGSGYTGYRTKACNGSNGQVNSVNVGGNYVVDARMQRSSTTGGGAGPWTRDFGDNTSKALLNDFSRNNSVRVQFSNDVNTTVSVQVSGRWSPDVC